MRLDLYVSQKLNISRNKAQFVIEKSNVLIDWKIITKSWFEVLAKHVVEILENYESKYVARSALKLKWLFESEKTDISEKICFDVGSSTWWFCQVLLENNAKKIYALDVWTSQLHEKLKNNEKIISIENTDIRKFDKKILSESIDIITCDVSFISLELVIDAILNLWNETTKYFLLYKPQYEVWKINLTKFWTPKNQKVID